MKKLEELLEWGGIKKDIILLLLGGIALVCSILQVKFFGVDAAWVTVFLCGLPIILEAVTGLVTAFDIKADVLVSLALIASLGIEEYFAAGEIAFIMQIGALLEEITVERAKSGIEKLIHLTPREARRITDGKEEMINAQEVEKGDVLRVLPGEMIPADGVIIKGETSVDQSVMTGESIPVDKKVGDDVKSGTMNQYGFFEMKTSCRGDDSSMQRMIKLVQSADANKAQIVGIADRWATWIVVTALTAALGTWLITGEIIRSVTILVVFCPCALVLATPTAIMAAIGNLTGYGVLVRQGDALERLAEIKKITFDKTGTLTYGRLRVTAVESLSEEIGEEKLYAAVAAAESRSEHPLGKAVAESYKEQYGQIPGEVTEFHMFPGRGVSAVIDGVQVLAGSIRFMQDHGIWPKTEDPAIQYIEKGSTIIYVAVNGSFAGFLALTDIIREDAANVVNAIKELKITPVLLTGDRREAAGAIAEKTSIQDCRANCLPEDKIRVIDEFTEKKEKVCMVGDGVNDAPALKKAYVGIAMGGIGSDIAIEAADIALVRDDISVIPHTIALARRMMMTIKINMIFSMGINIAAILLAMSGLLNPVAGAFIHNGGSVLVIIHSALLLKWKKVYRSK